MDIKVLVYDNQKGYFKWLKKIIKKDFSFYRYDGKNADKDYNVVAFFLHEELELLEFLKLYREDAPVVFASEGGTVPDRCRGNVMCLDLRDNKDKITEELKQIFSSIKE